MAAITFVRPVDAWPMLGCKRSTGHVRVKQQLLPPPVPLGPKRANGSPSMVGFIASELQAINAARAAGKSDDEIRELVAALVAARSKLTLVCEGA